MCKYVSGPLKTNDTWQVTHVSNYFTFPSKCHPFIRNVVPHLIEIQEATHMYTHKYILYIYIYIYIYVYIYIYIYNMHISSPMHIKCMQTSTRSIQGCGTKLLVQKESLQKA